MSLKKRFAKESDFQSFLISELTARFPDAIILKNDPMFRVGIPDLLVLCGRRWAALEVKISPNAKHQPGQDFYVHKMAVMSYAAFVYPENYQEVLSDLERALCNE